MKKIIIPIFSALLFSTSMDAKVSAIVIEKEITNTNVTPQVVIENTLMHLEEDRN